MILADNSIYSKIIRPCLMAEHSFLALCQAFFLVKEGIKHLGLCTISLGYCCLVKCSFFEQDSRLSNCYTIKPCDIT